jgi:hypothetical protein
MVCIEWFDSKNNASQAEIKAVQTENPKFNIRYVKDNIKNHPIYDIDKHELAKLFNLTLNHADNIRRGIIKVPEKYCTRISKHFNIPLHYLRPDIYQKI